MNNETYTQTKYLPLEIESERAVLSPLEQRLSRIEQDIPYYPATHEESGLDKRVEIILNPELTQVAGKILWFGVATGGGIAAVGAGVWVFLELTAIGGAAITANLIGIKYGIIGLSVIAIIYLISKIKVRTSVEYRDSGTTINKTYNQYNDCSF